MGFNAFRVQLPSEEQPFQRFQNFRLKNGSYQGENLALTVFHLSHLIDSGGSEGAGSYLRLIDCVHHSILGLKMIKKKKGGRGGGGRR